MCGFLDVHDTVWGAFGLLTADPKNYGISQSTERAAPLHPVCCIQKLYGRVIVSRPQHGGKPAYLLHLEQLFYFTLLGLGDRPKSFSQRDGRSHVLDPILCESLP